MNREYIYLAVIIIYLLSRITPFIIQGRKINKMLGYKVVKINGLIFIIKKISPLDFVEDEYGFPLTFLSYAKGKTLWEQVRDEKEEVDLEPVFELAKKICEKAVVYWPNNYKASDFFNKENKKAVEISWKIYEKILAHNLKFFRKPLKINKNYAISVAELCDRFGTRPSDYLKIKGLTDIEKYMIDNYFHNALLEKENAEKEKQNRAARKK